MKLNRMKAGAALAPRASKPRERQLKRGRRMPFGRHLLLLVCMLAGTWHGPQGAHAAEHTFRLGHGIAEEHPLGQGARHFASLLERKSGGRLTMRVYPATQLGSEGQMIAAVRAGTQDIVITSSAPVATMIDQYLLFDLPFLVNNEKEADALLDGPIGERLLGLAESRQMIGLCYWENGFRQVTNSRREVKSLDDMAGLKLRTMQNPVYIDAFRRLGANAIPMPFTELYTAMESRAIDAQENPIAIIHSNRFHEVQRYVTLSNHAYAPYVVLMSAKRWHALDEGDRKLLREGCHEARDHQRELNRKLTATLVDDLKREGMTITPLSDAEVQRFRARLEPVVEQYTKQIGPELVREARQQLQEMRTTPTR